MNRSGGNSSSSRGRGRQSWQKVTIDSSPNPEIPVLVDASPKGRMSGSLDRKVHSSWQVKGHNSDSAVSRNYENVTPAGSHGQQLGSSTFRSGSYLHGGRAKQWRPSSKASVTDDSSHGEQYGSTSVEEKVSINLEHSVTESVHHLKNLSRLSLDSSKASVTDDSSHGEQYGSTSVEVKVSINHEHSVTESVHHLKNLSRLSLDSTVGISHSNSGAEVPESTGNEHGNGKEEHSDCSTPIEVFDICPPKSGSVITLKPSLLAKNREKRNEMKNSIGGLKGHMLRSGMILLKCYLSSAEQAKIIRICQTHGLGPAGFYQPLYREGGKLHLKMMCFGEFWDPETNKYGKVRPMDHAKPPAVPPEFLLFVDRAMKDSYSLIAEHSGSQIVEDVLPPVKPDICLVNYYATTGRLGLHQDKDEGQDSLRKGIPIVSFSIGDSAEFLYGDQVDVKKADKVILESGDVLIFGGKSRHIFHGVSKILKDTAPKSLLEETNFRPGRLNLTFRQHL